MINRIWGLKQLWLHVNGHVLFHSHGIHWAVRNMLVLKNSKWKYMSRYDSNPHLATQRPVNQRLRPLSHIALVTMWIYVLQNSGIKSITPLRDNTCQSDYGYICIWTDCQTKSKFHISINFLASITTFYRIEHWLSKHIWDHKCIVTCQFLFIYQDTVRL